MSDGYGDGGVLAMRLMAVEKRLDELERLLTTRVKTVPARTIDTEALLKAKPDDIIPIVEETPEGAPV